MKTDRKNQKDANNLYVYYFKNTLKLSLNKFHFLISGPSFETNYEKVGFIGMMVLFGIIISPMALSENDPYQLQAAYVQLTQFFYLSNYVDLRDQGERNSDWDDYEIIDGIKYRVLINERISFNDPTGDKYLVPNMNGINSGKKF